MYANHLAVMSAPHRTDQANPHETATHLLSSRPDGVGYIDQAELDPATTLADLAQPEDADTSGSSVEEETEEDLPEESTWGGGDVWDPSVALTSSAAANDQDPGSGISDTDEEWGVENEDWELAKGGQYANGRRVTGMLRLLDFTKQYNRARQQRNAVNGTGASSSRVPLPALNPHAPTLEAGPSRTRRPIIHPSVFSAGVSVNPKSALDKHDKDKSDRATQEQVLDSRTRLVLQGLTKRGLIGSLERCVSTGKEVSLVYVLPRVTDMGLGQCLPRVGRPRTPSTTRSIPFSSRSQDI